MLKNAEIPASPADTLRGLLTGGPLSGREATKRMAAAGHSPKQTRKAREWLSVVTERGSGFGPQSFTIWRLPEPREAPVAPKEERLISAQVLPLENVAGRVHGSESCAHTSGGSYTRSDDALTEVEARRVSIRIEVFQRRGVSAGEAHQIAHSLVAVDRAGRHAVGSCAQCQSWLRCECAERRPATEIHTCWRRRADTP